MKKDGYIVYATLLVDGAEQKMNFFRGSEKQAAKLMQDLRKDGYYDMRAVNTKNMAWCPNCQKRVEVKQSKDESSGEAMETCSVCGKEILDDGND